MIIFKVIIFYLKQILKTQKSFFFFIIHKQAKIFIAYIFSTQLWTNYFKLVLIHFTINWTSYLNFKLFLKISRFIK